MLVCPIIAPDFARKVPKWGIVVERDVRRLGRVLRDGWRPPEAAEGRRIVIARSVERLRECVRELGPGDVGFDVETVGLGPTETALVCYAISDGMLTVVVPWSETANGRDPYWSAASRAEVVALTNGVFASRVVVTHNGPAFDQIVARRYGLEIRAWADTLNAAHVLESHLPKNLAHVVTQGLDVPAWKQQEDRGADIERLYYYNARDTLYTLLRWLQLRDELDTTP